MVNRSGSSGGVGRFAGGRKRAWLGGLALVLLAVAPGRGAEADRLPGRTVGSGLSVQFTDKFLHGPEWRGRLDLVAALGATVVRVDLNWDWVERSPGVYDWSLYDQYADALQAHGLRPLFILNRTNPLHGKSYTTSIGGRHEAGTAPPESAADIAAFARWAVAATERYRRLDPIWELWNEPDEEGSWPPQPRPQAYVALARATCRAIRARVPEAVVVGPAAAQIPTVWRSAKPLFAALMADVNLLGCLDALSVHTHRFRQPPETVSRDYAVLKANYLAIWPSSVPKKPILDTEWGDSVARSGISEDLQARWLPRMILVNLIEQVELTNWYCLMDVGPDDSDIEHRFGLVRFDGSQRPAYRAYQVLARELGQMVLREVVSRFDVASASGATVLRFCDAEEHCKLAAWSTEASAPRLMTIPGWRRAGPTVGHLGEVVSDPDSAGPDLRIEVTPAVRYVPVTPLR